MTESPALQALSTAVADLLGLDGRDPSSPSLVATRTTASGIEVTLRTAELAELQLEITPTSLGARAWRVGPRLAVSYRPIDDPRAAAPLSATLSRLERALTANDPPGAAAPRVERLMAAFTDGRTAAALPGARPERAPSDEPKERGELAAIRALASHYHQVIEGAGPVEHIAHAALELGLVDHLVAAGAPQHARDLADACACDPRSTRLLLRALAALDVLEEVGQDTFAITAEAARLLRQLRPVLAWRRVEAERWSRLAERVRTGRDADAFDVIGGGLAHPWLRAMGALQDLGVGAEIASLPIAGVRRLLDVGAGAGRYAAAMLRAHPELHVTAVDHPRAIDVARDHLRDEGLLDRATVVAVDFFDPNAELPGGHDAAWIAGVLHVQDEPACRDLLRRVRRALATGGVVIVQERLDDLDSPRARVNALAYHVMSTTARCHSRAALESMLREAGFADVSELASSPVGTLLLGR